MIVDIQNSQKKAKSLVYDIENKICEVDYVFTNSLELTSENDAHIMIGYDGDNTHFPKMEIKSVKFFYSNTTSQYVIFNKCQKCPLGYFLDLEKKYCVNCHVNCKNCFGLTENDCLNCVDNKFLFYIDEQKGKCIDSCSGVNFKSNLVSELIPNKFDKVDIIDIHEIISSKKYYESSLNYDIENLNYPINMKYF